MIHYAEVWKINKDSKIPYTDQLVRNIRWSIFTGEVRWTEKLPPIRVLADELGISINTVRNAYKRLEQQELVVTRPQIGTIVQTESMDKKSWRRNWSHPLKTPFIISFLWTRYGALWTRS